MNKIGILIRFEKELSKKLNFKERFEEAMSLGIESCQICFPEGIGYTDEVAEKINDARRATGIEISLLWAGWSGRNIWNFTEGPDTLGIVPREFRDIRIKELKAASVFAEKIGVSDIATHAGFLPENPSDPEYEAIVLALRELCLVYKSRGQNFLFETGQETPVTLLRTIEKIGTGNVFINFDTANLILYGKANSADAVRVFGKYVRNTHIKDGLYPTDPMKLGDEVKIGNGLADFPLILKLLSECGYTGPLTIEREIEGEEQTRDIIDAVKYLKEIAKK